MAEKTIAERIYTAYLTGTEADFYDNGITYTFTPDGLRDFIGATGDGITPAELETALEDYAPISLEEVEAAEEIVGTGELYYDGGDGLQKITMSELLAWIEGELEA